MRGALFGVYRTARGSFRAGPDRGVENLVTYANTRDRAKRLADIYNAERETALEERRAARAARAGGGA